ncbi:MAG: glycosyltransferase [Gammaproteobacteria bacterium]
MKAHRVLVLTSTYPRYTGDAAVPPFVHELTRRLAARFEMHVLAPHAPDIATEETMDEVHVHRFRYLPERFETLAYGGGMLPALRRRPWRAMGLPPFLWREYSAARRLLGQGGFDLIHAHWAIPHGFIAARLKGDRALLCTSHGSDLFALDTAWVRPFKRHTLRRADAVTVVSEALRDKVRHLAPDVTAEVLPMGVDMAQFTPSHDRTPRDGLLYVGRLVQEKGIEELLRALTDPRLRSRQIRLRIVGSGPAEADLRSISKELGLASQVEFLGALTNTALPGLYRKAEALVFPSRLGPKGEQEGLGLVPVEAIACGCPVIASRLPAVAEVVREGKTGFLFTPGDVASLVGCIARLFADPQAAARAAAGRQTLASRYDWDGIVDGYRRLYTRLLENRRTLTSHR